MDAVERTLDWREIIVSPELQVRQFLALGEGKLALREATVMEYRELLAQGVDMGRLIVVAEQDADGAPTGTLLLADGFHRLEAMRWLGRTAVDVLLYTGTRDDAILLACELNAHRGLPYGPEDKRQVARRYLEACERKGQPLSDSEVARRLGFSRRTVERARADSEELSRLARPRMVTRHGTTYSMQPRQPAAPHPSELLPTDMDAEPEDDAGGIFNRSDPSAYAPTPPPERPSPRERRWADRGRPSPRPTHTKPQPPTPMPHAITLIVHWAYQDAQGRGQAGSTDQDHLDKLPTAVRARLLQGLIDER